MTLLPLELLRAPRGDSDGRPRIQGLLGRAADVVDAAPEFRAVVAQLLSNTWLVADLAGATAIARRHADRPRLVTLEGDVLEPGGAISGGRRTGGATVLGLGRDLERAEAATRTAAAGGRRARAANGGPGARPRGPGPGQRAAGRRRPTPPGAPGARRSAAAASASPRSTRREARGGPRSWPRPRGRRTTVPWPHGPPRGGGARHGGGGPLGRRGGAAEAAEARRGAGGGDGCSPSRPPASPTNRRWSARAGGRAPSRRTTGKRSHAGARRTGPAAAAAEAALPRDLDAGAEALAADEAQPRAEASLRQHTEGQARAGDALETARLALARREAALELALDERAALPTGVETLVMSERVARARWREVEAALEALGPVNQRAAIDHAAQSERLSELEDEGAQAAAAVAELASTLATIDAETTGRLNTALKGLQEGFAEHVRQLFGPTALGSIDIEREGERPVGVRIRLQPPGKRTESLNLLSVGERTMGAMAFLFALMAGDIGNLPIAVLDEVDAPLDEANIRRFCGFIEALSSRGTQFVLITHQKATFEVADTLWGVTSDDGVSRVFSMRREEPRGRAAVGAGGS